MPATKRRLSWFHNESPYVQQQQQQQQQQGSHLQLSEKARENQRILDRADAILAMIRSKRPRLHEPTNSDPDRISKLSDEILLRILGYMNKRELLDLSLVSKRFHEISADPILWRDLYYDRFVLPRADQIPGFRAENAAPSTSLGSAARRPFNPVDPSDRSANVLDYIDWKKQYKMKTGWSKHQCEVYHVCLYRSGGGAHMYDRETLVKMTDKFIVTADKDFGLRVWEIRTGHCLAHTTLTAYDGVKLTPTCLYIEARKLFAGILEIMVGFADGTFGLWKFDLDEVTLDALYRQESNFFHHLVAIAYSYPYVVTASRFGFVSIYSFEHQEVRRMDAARLSSDYVDDMTTETSQMPTPAATPPPLTVDDSNSDSDIENRAPATATAPAQPPVHIGYSNMLARPILISQLKSHNSRSPISLFMRQVAGVSTLSIAHTFKDSETWWVGVQDFSIHPASRSKRNCVISTDSYYTAIDLPAVVAPPPPTPVLGSLDPYPRHQHEPEADGPQKLVYSHPYILSVLPDDSMILHMCTTDPTSHRPRISRGVRLSGYLLPTENVDVTPRGHAVSFVSRGEEIRIWDLEAEETEEHQSWNDYDYMGTPMSQDLDAMSSHAGSTNDDYLVLS